MPSLLDHLESGDAAPSPSAPVDLIDSVKAEGRRRRTVRHRRNLAVALLGLTMVALPAVALRPDGDGPQREVSVATEGGDQTLTEAIPEAASSVLDTLPADAVVVPPDTPAVTEPPTVATSAPATTVPPATVARVTPRNQFRAVDPTVTTTKPTCRNSDQPSCGPFRWNPAPSPNQPLVASFSKAPRSGVVGQSVTFEVTWSDGDARLSFDNFTTDGTVLVGSCSIAPRYGPWTPPAAAAGSGTLRYPHTFTSPGVYEVNVGLSTASCASPYGSDTVVKTEIRVDPAP